MPTMALATVSVIGSSRSTRPRPSECSFVGRRHRINFCRSKGPVGNQPIDGPWWENSGNRRNAKSKKEIRLLDLEGARHSFSKATRETPTGTQAELAYPGSISSEPAKFSGKAMGHRGATGPPGYYLGATSEYCTLGHGTNNASEIPWRTPC